MFWYSSGEKLPNISRLNFSPTSGSRAAFAPTASEFCKAGIACRAAIGGRGVTPSGGPEVTEVPTAATAVAAAATAAEATFPRISAPPGGVGATAVSPTPPPPATPPSTPPRLIPDSGSNVVEVGATPSRDTSRVTFALFLASGVRSRRMKVVAVAREAERLLIADGDVVGDSEAGVAVALVIA